MNYEKKEKVTFYTASCSFEEILNENLHLFIENLRSLTPFFLSLVYVWPISEDI